MLQSTADLCSIKLDPVLLEAGRAHVVGVKLQVSTVHDGQHQTERVFGFIGIRQTHLDKKESSVKWRESA